MIGLDFEQLRRVDAIFAHRWEVFVLTTLAEGPRRYNELAHVISVRADARVSDSTLSRLRKRLLSDGVIEARVDDDGHTVYALTPLGQTKATRIATIIAFLASLNLDDVVESEPLREGEAASG